MSRAIAEHYEARDLAIRKLIDLYNDDYDISDRELFNAVLERHGLLEDGFCSEEDYIMQEVERRIR
jgi:hypothetical protein